MLSRERAEFWIEQLRSKKYEQYRGGLASVINVNDADFESASFCCLGVLSKSEGGLAAYSRIGNLTYPEDEESTARSTSSVGCRLRVGELDQDSFMRMNDEEVKSFEEIADAIQHELDHHPFYNEQG